MNRKRIYLLLRFAIFAPVLAAACAWWFHPNTRQHRLDAQLFVAIAHDDTPAVVSLLEQGANPNAHSEIGATSPSFLQWVRENVLFRRAVPSAPKYVFSAFDAALFQPDVANPDIVLATALLEHGAKLKNPYGLPVEIVATPLTLTAPKAIATLNMPYGHTSWQNTTGLGAMGSGITEIQFRGTPRQIDVFVKAAIKAGAKPTRW